MMESSLNIVANPPNKIIDDFKGFYEVEGENLKEALSLENTLWANTILAS